MSNENQRRFVREGLKSCRFLNGFLDNLLEASVPPEATPALEVRYAPLEPAIRDVVSFLRPVLEEHRVRVDMRLDDQVLEAAFDPARIEQVLLNLLGNAIRHARAGGRVEVTTALRESMGRRFVEVAVTDDGPGIPEEDRNRIFEPYQRAGGEAPGGLGLGLAICRSIVAAHGGTIGVTEGPAGGSRFAFLLPLPECFPGMGS
jgi:two-component system sensor histidine kinase KdpD